MDSLLAPVSSIRQLASNVAWEPLVGFSRSTILSVLKQIRYGSLKIIDNDGYETICGDPSPAKNVPQTSVEVHKDTFWVRMLLFADMGFAESYMLSEFSCPDLTAFFEIFIRNKNELSNGSTLVSKLSQTVSNIARRTNTLANARLNISAHYDLGNEMFKAFLSEDMTYSCPIWLPATDPDSLKESLESAQERKLQRFISNAKIKSTDHVLEIGTGWGSFAIAAVRKTGCRVTSVTLSKEQKQLAEQRIADAGFTDNVEVLLCDYRALPMPKDGPYDKVVSIEMLEAVGREFLTTYFDCINKLLKPEGGIAVFQCITIPEARYEAYHASTDFIRSYIFPGGHLPAISTLVSAIAEGAKGSLVVDAIENIGPHYARTLRKWQENFERHFDDRIRPALLQEHAGMTESDVQLFRRKWIYYFTYCEAGFRTCTLGDHIVTVAREGAMEVAEDVRL